MLRSFWWPVAAPARAGAARAGRRPPPCPPQARRAPPLPRCSSRRSRCRRSPAWQRPPAASCGRSWAASSSFNRPTAATPGTSARCRRVLQRSGYRSPTTARGGSCRADRPPGSVRSSSCGSGTPLTRVPPGRGWTRPGSATPSARADCRSSIPRTGSWSPGTRTTCRSSIAAVTAAERGRRHSRCQIRPDSHHSPVGSPRCRARCTRSVRRCSSRPAGTSSGRRTAGRRGATSPPRPRGPHRSRSSRRRAGWSSSSPASRGRPGTRAPAGTPTRPTTRRRQLPSGSLKKSNPTLSSGSSGGYGFSPTSWTSLTSTPRRRSWCRGPR